MAFSSVRNYFQERLTRLTNEWKLFQSSGTDPSLTQEVTADSDLTRLYHGSRNVLSEQQKAQALQSMYEQIVSDLQSKDNNKNEPFEFYSSEPISPPAHREPAPGLRFVPHLYHKGQTVTTSDQVPETGFKVHPLIMYLVKSKYPQYVQHLHKYCRPLGTTDATFSDFNREQVPSPSIPNYRKERILKHVFRFLDAEPYLPIHFVDTQYAKLPLSTGTGYHNRHAYNINAHAHYSHPDEYSDRHTSKGYYINAFLENARRIVHIIKETGLPFEWSFPTDDTPETQSAFLLRLNQFLNEYPTILFTRNHISDRDGNLKQRPVYAVDDLFLLIETMLTFPLLVQARKMSCCIMYGLETIRGSNVFLDKVAQMFTSYFTIDWSQFDQRLPRIITDAYYMDFLPRLIVINHGYQPTYEYPTYPDLDSDKLYNRMSNLLSFLHLWYNNMTFLSADGFAYRRTHAGVPSGLFNTQYLDSFGNLYLIIDGMIEFGLSDEDIMQVLLFIMGDDNSGFTTWPISKLETFIQWFESYASSRYNMILSKSKSVITTQRQHIETLSYRCNFGAPFRPIPKLVAQLCYPEHGPNDKYMSARAIGMAYAASGSDKTFHDLCRDIYFTFLPYAADINDPRTFEIIGKHLPGAYKTLDAYTEIVDLSRFPTLLEIRSLLAHWQGPLHFDPKWNFAHFINAPNVIPPSAKTMYEYDQEHGIIRFPPPLLPTSSSGPI